jgi:hypothetical protein
VQFLVDYRIGLGEQVAFTVETSKLPVNTWYVCINALCQTDKRAAHSVVSLGVGDLRALNPTAARAIDPPPAP